MNRSFTVERRKAWARAEKASSHIICQNEREKNASDVFNREFERLKQLTIEFEKRKAEGAVRSYKIKKRDGDCVSDFTRKPCTIEKLRNYL